MTLRKLAILCVCVNAFCLEMAWNDGGSSGSSPTFFSSGSGCAMMPPLSLEVLNFGLWRRPVVVLQSVWNKEDWRHPAVTFQWSYLLYKIK